jgi:hypothetical protein
MGIYQRIITHLYNRWYKLSADSLKLYKHDLYEATGPDNHSSHETHYFPILISAFFCNDCGALVVRSIRSDHKLEVAPDAIYAFPAEKVKTLVSTLENTEDIVELVRKLVIEK